MSNPSEKLVGMANQIAAFFAPYGEVEAEAGVSDHINRFWTAPMRRGLVALGAEAPALAPAVRRAMPRIRI